LEEIENEITREDTASNDIEKLERENQELKDKYLRLFAEFDNYKKRTVKERLELMRTAAQETILAILPVLDDFDRAKKLADEPDSKEVFSEGANIVYHKLYAVLKNKGLEPMETHHQDFDPEFHEALTEIPAPTDALKGKIIDTIEKGYKLGDKIIRYAKVVVGN
jgi:molecular chaperone GrpE